MCLYATTREALVAEEDITVIKVVKVQNGKYYSPFQGSPLYDNVLNKNVTANEAYGKYIVDYQGIHAYVSSKMAIRCRRYLELMSKGIIYKFISGIILKGTHYWRSEEGEIAAKYIKFDRSEEII